MSGVRDPIVREHGPHRESLGLPPFIEELARRSNGLVLIAGPTGVGKTTTMNFMIDAINRNRRRRL
jgi:twitching motility protein PilT